MSKPVKRIYSIATGDRVVPAEVVKETDKTYFVKLHNKNKLAFGGVSRVRKNDETRAFTVRSDALDALFEHSKNRVKIAKIEFNNAVKAYKVVKKMLDKNNG